MPQKPLLMWRRLLRSSVHSPSPSTIGTRSLILPTSRVPPPQDGFLSMGGLFRRIRTGYFFLALVWLRLQLLQEQHAPLTAPHQAAHPGSVPRSAPVTAAHNSHSSRCWALAASASLDGPSVPRLPSLPSPQNPMDPGFSFLPESS